MSLEIKVDTKQSPFNTKRVFALSRRNTSHYSMEVTRTNQYHNPNIKSLEKQFGYISRPKTSVVKIMKSSELSNTQARRSPASHSHCITALKDLQSDSNRISNNIRNESCKSPTPPKEQYFKRRVEIVLSGQTCSEHISFSFQETPVASNEKLEFNEGVCPLTLSTTKWTELEHITGKCNCRSCVCGFHICQIETNETNTSNGVVIEAKNKYVKRPSIRNLSRECYSPIRFHRYRSSFYSNRMSSESQHSRDTSPKDEIKKEIETHNSAREMNKLDKTLNSEGKINDIQRSFDKGTCKERYSKVKGNYPVGDSKFVKPGNDRFTGIRPYSPLYSKTTYKVVRKGIK